MTGRWTRHSLAALLGLALAVPVAAQSGGSASENYRLERSGVAGGGGTSAGGDLEAEGVGGQPSSTGAASSPSFSVSTGLLDDTDLDRDGVLFGDDACAAVPGLADRQGCLYGLHAEAELHVVDKARSGACPDGKPSCKLPLAGAEVRVFDRDDEDFRDTWGSGNPHGSTYDDVFEHPAGRIGRCTVGGEAACAAGLHGPASFLVIARYADPATGMTVFTGRPGDGFTDTDGDGAGDLAGKQLQILKHVNKSGSVSYGGGSKTVVHGSFIEIVAPDCAFPQDVLGEVAYPWVFNSDSHWDVRLCPAGEGLTLGALEDAAGEPLPLDADGCAEFSVDEETRGLSLAVQVPPTLTPGLEATLHVVGGHAGTSRTLNLAIAGICDG